MMNLLLCIISLLNVVCFAASESCIVDSCGQGYRIENNQQQVGYNGLERSVYNGDYSTVIYIGNAEYQYIKKHDGTRVYDGNFSFQGSAIYMNNEEIVGPKMIYQTKDEEDYYENILRNIDLKDRIKDRFSIKGDFKNGLKTGKWISIREEFHYIKRKFVPVDTCIFNYKDGYLDGELYYVHYDITGKLRKKEEVRYCLGVVQNATVYHYGFHKEKYNSYYENGKPAGIWVDERENGAYRINFNDKSVCFENNQTGFVEVVRRSFSIFTPEMKPFKDGFSGDAYRDRIGNFGVGDRFKMVLYGGEKPVINQL